MRNRKPKVKAQGARSDHGEPKADATAQPAEAIRPRAVGACPEHRPELRHLSQGDPADEPRRPQRAQHGMYVVCTDVPRRVWTQWCFFFFFLNDKQTAFADWTATYGCFRRGWGSALALCGL